MKHLKCGKIIPMICLFMILAMNVEASAVPIPHICDSKASVEALNVESVGSSEEQETIQDIITRVANKYEIAPTLMMAIAEIESGYNPDAVSSTGDYGLMQINKMNHEWLGLDDWSDPEQSVEAACKMINWLRSNYEECEDISCCMMAYNMGIGNARKLWKQGIYQSAYSIKVLDKEIEISNKLYGKE